MFSNTPKLYITYIYRRPKSGESKVAILESPLLTFFWHLVIIPSQSIFVNHRYILWFIHLFLYIGDLFAWTFIYQKLE